MLTAILKGGLSRFGYEIRNFKSTANTNPFFALRRLLRNQASVIFDVGANKGDITATYRSMFPSATIYAFEPFPGAYEALKSRFESTREVQAFPYAVSAESGKKSLMVYSSDVLNSFLEMEESSWLESIDVKTDRAHAALTANHPPEDHAEKVEVDCITLDEFAAQHKVTHIDLLKLDVQGVELQVLEGAKALLSSEAIDVVFCEANFAPQYKGQAYFRDVDKAMSDHRYRVFGLYELTSGGDGSLGFGNAIFISSAFHKKIAAPTRYWQPL